LITTKTCDRCSIVKVASGHTIDQVNGSEESFIPKTNWERGVRENGDASLDDMHVLALGDAVLLRSVRANNAMLYACFVKVTRQSAIFATAISLNSKDFGL
jgi:hypothetical protein